MGVGRGLVNCAKRLYGAATYERSLLGLVLNFAVMFSPVFLWLFIFKHAGVIPTSWRPGINAKSAFFLDLILFGDHFNEYKHQYASSSSHFLITSIVTSAAFLVLCTTLPLAIWYYIYYIRKVNYNVLEWNEQLFHWKGDGIQSEKHYFNPKSPRVLLPFFVFTFVFTALNIAHAFARQDNDNFTKTKDILAWVWYVMLHLIAPIVTAVYLYVFHPPGTLKCFSFALGIQNIAGVITHLLIPTAPPWFIHMYGIHDKEHVNYEQPGYAAGLTRVDMHLGTHLNSNGFHKSPIVFGAVPSLHSAIAFQCFLFIMLLSSHTKGTFAKKLVTPDTVSSSSGLNTPEYDSSFTRKHTDDPFELSLRTDSDTELMLIQEEPLLTEAAQFYRRKFIECTPQHPKWLYIINKGYLAKIIVTSFLCIQWWATMYLDHHFRYDLIVGALYAVTAFLIVNTYILQPRVLDKWARIRLYDVNDSEGKTMGMRVFSGTKFEWFFDPLA